MPSYKGRVPGRKSLPPMEDSTWPYPVSRDSFEISSASERIPLVIHVVQTHSEDSPCPSTSYFEAAPLCSTFPE